MTTITDEQKIWKMLDTEQEGDLTFLNQDSPLAFRACYKPENAANEIIFETKGTEKDNQTSIVQDKTIDINIDIKNIATGGAITFKAELYNKDGRSLQPYGDENQYKIGRFLRNWMGDNKTWGKADENDKVHIVDNPDFVEMTRFVNSVKDDVNAFYYNQDTKSFYMQINQLEGEGKRPLLVVLMKVWEGYVLDRIYQISSRQSGHYAASYLSDITKSEYRKFIINIKDFRWPHYAQLVNEAIHLPSCLDACEQGPIDQNSAQGRALLDLCYSNPKIWHRLTEHTGEYLNSSPFYDNRLSRGYWIKGSETEARKYFSGLMLCAMEPQIAMSDGFVGASEFTLSLFSSGIIRPLRQAKNNMPLWSKAFTDDMIHILHTQFIFREGNHKAAQEHTQSRFIYRLGEETDPLENINIKSMPGRMMVNLDDIKSMVQIEKIKLMGDFMRWFRAIDDVPQLTEEVKLYMLDALRNQDYDPTRVALQGLIPPADIPAAE